MTYSDDDIIRNGTLRQWLNYAVLPHRIKGKWIVCAVALVFFGLGKLL